MVLNNGQRSRSEGDLEGLKRDFLSQRSVKFQGSPVGAPERGLIWAYPGGNVLGAVRFLPSEASRGAGRKELGVWKEGARSLAVEDSCGQ